jgi:tRNA-dihydrouridine synthase A
MAHFVDTVAATGCTTFIVHARKAWLKGLSPKENRQLPPLRYAEVYRLKREFPHLTVIINGGIHTLAECNQHLQHVDGVMLGRAAYHDPYLLSAVDRQLFDAAAPVKTRSAVVEQLLPYIEQQMQRGATLHHITRHILGLYQGEPGARRFRRLLSEGAPRPGATLDVLTAALAAIQPAEPAALSAVINSGS